MLVQQELSADLRRLLDAGIDSLDKLEVVVALYRAPERSLNFGALRERLDLDRDELRRSLRELAAAGFVTEGDERRVTLSRLDAEREPRLSEIVTLYEQDKTRLVIAITEISLDRIRALAARAFADAFVIRRRKGDDHDP